MSQQNSIENLTVAMGAGESRIFMVSGKYFEILEAPKPIDVLLSDINGAQRARLYQAEASYFSKGVEFAVIQITSATAQTVRVVYGTGESGTRRTTGSMTISGAVALDAATLAALEQINVRPDSTNGEFSDTTTMVAGGVLTVLSAAANTNGAVLLAANGWDYVSGNGTQAFIARSGAPSTMADGDVVAGGVGGLNASLTWTAIDLKIPQFIEAGKGLYFLSTYAGQIAANGAYRSARWKLL